jgi:hypothetical protein
MVIHGSAMFFRHHQTEDDKSQITSANAFSPSARIDMDASVMTMLVLSAGSER